MSEVTSASKVGGAFSEGFVEADGFRIRFMEAGSGEPVVVLHGAGGPRLNPALDILSQRFRIVLFEMPGFGPEVNERTRSIEEMADTMVQAATAAGLADYHLLGTSFGGAVALCIALRSPDRLRSLILEAPGAFREGMNSPVGVSPEDMVRRMRAHPERPPQLTPESLQSGHEGRALVGRLLLSGPAYDPELATRLESVTVRTLVVFGDADGMLPPENGRTYRRLMPNCAFILVHDAGHDVQADRPEAFAELVGDFLERGMAFLIPDRETVLSP